MKMFLPALLFFIAAPVSSCKADDSLEKFAYSREWLRILHYQGGKSLVDAPEFFLSPNGVHDPAEELKAMVRALENPQTRITIYGQSAHPSCFFPARKRVIERELKTPLPTVDCQELDKYRKDTEAQSVSYLFSTAYPNNPGSAFGHTFIKFNRKKGSELLDPAVSYAAWVGQDSGIAFMVKGLFGGYPGAFSLSPYYQKVNEYNHSESRDIWEYELALSREEIDLMRDHIWELAKVARFDYYFFEENCAFILLRIIEVAKPTWDLSSFWYYVIPSESVKRLTETEGAITKVSVRPSNRSRFLFAFDQASEKTKHEFKGLSRGDMDAEQVGASALDLASVYYAYRLAEKLDSDPVVVEEKKRRVLQARAKLPASVSSASDRLDDQLAYLRPDLAHGPIQLGVSMGVGGGSVFSEYRFRFAYHDLMNVDLGFPKFSEIEFPGARVRLGGYDRQKLMIESIRAFSVVSLYPWTVLDRQFSWKMQMEYSAPKDFGCIDCHALGVDYGAGITLRAGENGVVAFLAAISPEWNTNFGGFGRLLEKNQLALIYQFRSRWKARLSAEINYDIFKSSRQLFHWVSEAQISLLLNQKFDARLQASRIYSFSQIYRPYQELSLGLNYYF